MSQEEKPSIERRILREPFIVAALGGVIEVGAIVLDVPVWLRVVGMFGLMGGTLAWLRKRIQSETIGWTLQAHSALVMRSLGDLVATVPNAPNREFDALANAWNDLLDSLAEQSGRYERTIEHISDGIATVTSQMVVRTINPAGVRLLGCRDAGEVVGGNFGSFMITPRDVDAVFESPDGCSLDCRTRDGQDIIIHAEATWHMEGEETIGLVVFRNITAQRDLEETLERARDVALQNAKLKAEFLANMSHEIRTPMNGLIGMIELLSDTRLDDDQREHVRTMSTSAESLLRIINDILDFSKIESGKLTIEETAFELKTMVDEMLTLVTLKASEKGVALNLEIKEDVWSTVKGDPTRVRQVLLNLVGNSVKFTERGFVNLTISRAPAIGEHTLQFEIRDSGIGMTADQCQHVFSKFVQADTSTTRRFGGTGLGLSITKQLVELMGGQIEVSSEAGVGSTFTVHLALPETTSVHTEAPEAPMRPQAETQLNVLLVDDNAVNQTVARRFLEKLGCSVTLADNGQQALDRMSDATFDIVFMDCQMPIMDGFDATRAIRQLEDDRSQVRIIAMTANAMTGDRERCLAAGMDDYLTKPIRIPLLKKALARGAARGTSMAQA